MSEIDPINKLATSVCTDTRHVIRFHSQGKIDTYTLAELDRRASVVANRLAEMGIKAKDRVGIVAQNRVEWVILDLAIMKVGGVTAGFEPNRFDPDELVKVYGLQLLFGEGLSNEGKLHDIALARKWSESFWAGPTDIPLHRGYDAADILAVRLTSGSTGAPKGLEVSVGSVNSSICAARDMFDHKDGDNILVFLPLGASLQQRYWLYSAFAFGHDATVSNFDEWIDAAAATSPTVIMGVPGFYEAVKDQIEPSESLAPSPAERGAAIQRVLGGRIRYLWTGSAPASPSLLQFFNGSGVPLYEGYGLTETCIVSKNHPGAYRIGSVGRVLPGKRVRFDKDDILIVGSEMPVNSRYTWCRPGESEKMFLPTAEVKTHDMGHMDSDGFLFIQGRVDDIVVMSSGLNVLVREVEEEIRKLPAVHECVLYGQGRPYLATVISQTETALDRRSLERHLQDWNNQCRPEQRVNAAVILAGGFSIENGLLTTQCKPLRKKIHAAAERELDAIYRQLGPADAKAGAILILEHDEA